MVTTPQRCQRTSAPTRPSKAGTTLFRGAAVFAACLLGCADKSPEDPDESADGSPVSIAALCKQEADTYCERIYECYTTLEVAAAGLPLSEQDCRSQRYEELDCDALTTANACANDGRFSTTQERACIDQIQKASCSDIRIGLLINDTSTFAPACDGVCS